MSFFKEYQQFGAGRHSSGLVGGGAILVLFVCGACEVEQTFDARVTDAGGVDATTPVDAEMTVVGSASAISTPTNSAPSEESSASEPSQTAPPTGPTSSTPALGSGPQPDSPSEGMATNTQGPLVESDAGHLECTSGDRRCDDNSPARCIDGTWDILPACSGDTPICNELSGACAACTPGVTKCTPAGQLAVCDIDGSWEVTACSLEVPECVGGQCLQCNPSAGDRRCQNNSVEECDDSGAWVIVQSCTDASTVCLQASGTCGTCTPGDTQCNGTSNAVATCNEAGQFVEEPCPASKPLCDASECVACAEGLGPQRTCAGDTPLLCAANSWIPQAPCGDDTPVCIPETGECACEDDTVRCQNDALLVCTGGVWITEQTCGGDYPVCDEELGRCSCAEGESKCTVGFDDSMQVCQGGFWTEAFCSGNTPVCVDGSCVECVPDSPPTCTNLTLNYCSFEATSAHEECDFMCASGDCLDTRTIADSYTCDAENGVVCAAPQICCNLGTATCLAAGSSCVATSTQAAWNVQCDGSSDCASGQVCCRHRSLQTSRFECELPEDCDAPQVMGTGDQIVCGPEDPCVSGTCTVLPDTGLSTCVD